MVGTGSVAPAPGSAELGSGGTPRPGEGWSRDEVCPMTWRGRGGLGRAGWEGHGTGRVAGEPWPPRPAPSLSQRFCQRRGWGSARWSGMRVRRQRERGRKGELDRMEGRAERERTSEDCPGCGPTRALSSEPPLGGSQRRWAAAWRGDGESGGQSGKPWRRPDAPATGARDDLCPPGRVGAVPTPLTPRWGMLPRPGAAHACPTPAAAPGWGSAAL